MDDEELDDVDSGYEPTPRPSGGGLSQVSYSVGRGDPKLRDEAIRARAAATASQSEYMSAMDAAIQRAIARRAGPSEREQALRMAAALGRPTRTGSTAESLSGAMEALADAEGTSRTEGLARDNAVDQLRLAAGRTRADLMSRDAQLASQMYLRDRPKVPDRVALIQAWQEAPEGSELRRQLGRLIDADVARSQPRPPAAPREPEAIQLARIAADETQPPQVRESARQRLSKLTHIAPPAGSIEKPAKLMKTERQPDGSSIKTYSDGSEELVPAPEGFKPPPVKLSPGDKKAIMDAESEIPKLESTISSLEEALQLVPKAYHGPGAAMFGKAGTRASQIPGLRSLVDGETARNTKRLLQLLDMQAIESMSATLTGATTNFELDEFKKILADPESPAADKERVLNRMAELFRAQRKLAQKRVSELREGTYYNPEGAKDDRSKGDNSKPTAAGSAPSGAPRRRKWVDGKFVDVTQ